MIRITTHFYIVSGRKVDASVVGNCCGPHLRSFRIQHDGDRQSELFPDLFDDIDFFLKVEDEIIPFDLKFTHISEAYFDLVSQGVL